MLAWLEAGVEPGSDWDGWFPVDWIEWCAGDWIDCFLGHATPVVVGVRPFGLLGVSYLPDPSKDPTFRVYFTAQWRDQLRLSLTNFLSLIFRAAPLPKLLLLEKWHRSESQLELKRGINQARYQVATLRTQLAQTQNKVVELLATTEALVSFVHQQTIESTRRLPVSGGLFEDDGAMELRLRQLRDTGTRVVRLSTRCAHAGGHTTLERHVDASGQLEEETSVANLVRSVDAWLRMLKSDSRVERT